MTTHCIWSHQHPPTCSRHFLCWAAALPSHCLVNDLLILLCRSQQTCLEWCIFIIAMCAMKFLCPGIEFLDLVLACQHDVIGCGSKMIPIESLPLAQPTAPPARPEWSAPPPGQFLASVASWEGRIIGRSRICRQLWASRSQSPGNSAVEYMEDNKSLIKMGQSSKILRSTLYTCMLNR